MAKKKSEKNVYLNGLNVTVKSKKKVVILDKMSNVCAKEAQQICLYLYREGFLSTDDITCEIVTS
jgi:hypothetical protein